MILTNGTRIDFKIENTPIANFCTSALSIVINGVSYTKSEIKEIHLGTSYSGVTDIGDYFLSRFSSLTDITLDFPALNSVGDNFMYGCTSLIDLTLNLFALNRMGGNFLYNCTSLIDVTLNFLALGRVGTYFMGYCSSLTNLTLNSLALNSVSSNFLHNCKSLINLTLTADTPNTASSSYFLYNASNLSSIYVPAKSVDSYKRKSPWSSKSDLIKPIPLIPSYMILTNNTRIDFKIENTPIANFCNYDSSMVINGVSYTKSEIKEIHFGTSYGGFTQGIGNGFLHGCIDLTNVSLTAEMPPVAERAYFMADTPLLSSIYVPAYSVNLYKTTSPWSIKASLIKAI